MRDLLYKNLTLSEKGRKIVTSSEVNDKEGIHSVVRRHFACMVKQVTNTSFNKPKPYLFVLKNRNTKEKREHFFCKIKGSLFAVNKEKLLLVSFIHTLSIELTASEKISGQIG